MPHQPTHLTQLRRKARSHPGNLDKHRKGAEASPFLSRLPSNDTGYPRAERHTRTTWETANQDPIVQTLVKWLHLFKVAPYILSNGKT